MDIPPLAYMCIYSDRASEIVTGDSTEFMQAYSNSVSHDASGSVSGGYGGASVSVEASYAAANSSARQSSSTARSNGMNKQMSTSAIATLYTFALKSGTEQSYLSEDFKSDLQSVTDEASAFQFIKTYGSHYLKKAKMGARFQENIYFSEDATESEMTKAR